MHFGTDGVANPPHYKIGSSFIGKKVRHIFFFILRISGRTHAHSQTIHFAIFRFFHRFYAHPIKAISGLRPWAGNSENSESSSSSAIGDGAASAARTLLFPLGILLHAGRLGELAPDLAEAGALVDVRVTGTDGARLRGEPDTPKFAP